ncbi:MAG: hypothetical protein KDC45_09370 [Bacteroidetes bacterium]|nr:hypothetical protein [Bacteroidota bacterium]
MARKKKEQTVDVELDDTEFVSLQSIGFECDGVIKQIAYGQVFKKSDVPERIFDKMKHKKKE